MAAYRRVDDLRSPAGWLPVHRDQLRAQRSVSIMGSLYLFYLACIAFDWKTRALYSALSPARSQHSHAEKSVLLDGQDCSQCYGMGRTPKCHHAATCRWWYQWRMRSVLVRPKRSNFFTLWSMKTTGVLVPLFWTLLPTLYVSDIPCMLLCSTRTRASGSLSSSHMFRSNWGRREAWRGDSELSLTSLLDQQTSPSCDWKGKGGL